MVVCIETIEHLDPEPLKYVFNFKIIRCNSRVSNLMEYIIIVIL